MLLCGDQCSVSSSVSGVWSSLVPASSGSQSLYTIHLTVVVHRWFYYNDTMWLYQSSNSNCWKGDLVKVYHLSHPGWDFIMNVTMYNMTVLLLLLLCCQCQTNTTTNTRITLLQQQVCRQEMSVVRCQCDQWTGAVTGGDQVAQVPAYLGIRMQGFLVHTQNNQVTFLKEGSEI